eukprot:scaffold657831_cov75-Prasinocladus_malaysianus.AAC.1
MTHRQTPPGIFTLSAPAMAATRVVPLGDTKGNFLPSGSSNPAGKESTCRLNTQPQSAHSYGYTIWHDEVEQTAQRVRGIRPEFVLLTLYSSPPLPDFITSIPKDSASVDSSAWPIHTGLSISHAMSQLAGIKGGSKMKTNGKEDSPFSR